MKLKFDLDFDGNVWPGPLSGRDAVVGEVWVGPKKLLNILETAYGLGGLYQGEASRAASLVPAVRHTKGFWINSAEVDPLGSARTLLRWRDELWMGGWRGRGVAPRLEELAGVTAGVFPGIPDRIQAVIGAVSKYKSGWKIREISLRESQEYLPALWKWLFQALQEGGTEILSLDQPDPAQAKGDLQSAKENKAFSPDRDGSLQFIRPLGKLAAAEEAAAWLSSGWKTEGTLVINPGAVLDCAFRRFGLPTIGSYSTDENLLLQVLPLMISLAWSPPDPAQALELLLLPESPVPRGLAGRLTGALQDWPAVDSDTWRHELEKGLEEINDPERRRRLRERLKTIFSSPLPRQGKYPLDELNRRVLVLEQWIRGRLGSEKEVLPWQLALAQCAELRQVLGLTELQEITEPQLEWLIEEATASASSPSAYPEEAGLPAVASPGAVAGPVERILWWGFSADSAPGVSRLPLSAEEKKALADSGVELADPGQQAAANARRWRLPLSNSTGSLCLVCPRRGDDGEECFPHPFWYEISSRFEGDREVLTVSQPLFAGKPKKEKQKLVLLPQPRPVWRLESGTQVRAQESPSSLGNLIGCPLKYTVEYLGEVSGGSASLPKDNLLIGNLLHKIIENVLKTPGLSPEQAAAAAREYLQSEGPRLAAAFFLPEAGGLLGQIRRVAETAARVMADFLSRAGYQPVAIEEMFQREAWGINIRGKSDLVLGARKISRDRFIVDLKWASDDKYIDSLKRGSCYQLAVYSYLVSAKKDPEAPVAYFILQSQRILTTDSKNFPGAEVFAGPGLPAVWEALGNSYRVAAGEVTSGEIRCPVPDEKGVIQPKNSKLDAEPNLLVLSPPCYFCDLGLICGQVGK